MSIPESKPELDELMLFPGLAAITINKFADVNPLELFTCDELVDLLHATDTEEEIARHVVSRALSDVANRKIAGLVPDIALINDFHPYDLVEKAFLKRPSDIDDTTASERCSGNCVEVCRKYDGCH